jgi:hypothetical protein
MKLIYRVVVDPLLLLLLPLLICPAGAPSTGWTVWCARRCLVMTPATTA